MPVIQYDGRNIYFKDLFYTYAKAKEGYRNSVYDDIKGFDTIGIGHLVTGNEPFLIRRGATYSDQQIKQLFDSDYDNMGIDAYVQELQDAGYSYNMMLAVAHFIWGHGNDDYDTSTLRRRLLDGLFDASSVQQYLKANWDIRSPTNQRVNKEDFTVGFSSTPWQPGYFFEAQEVLTKSFPGLADWVKQHQKIVTTALLLLILILLITLIYKRYKR